MIEQDSNILIVGGAGYIGAQMVAVLAAEGFTPVVLDNLSGGHAEAVAGAELIVGDAGDAVLLDQMLGTRRFAAVLHFASLIQVGESVNDPGKYYANNVAVTVTLLNALMRHGVKHFVFSSTAAIFGEPDYTPIDENHPTRPVNPYGRGKRMVEEMLADYTRAYGLRYGCLRYFNAAGADPDGARGECHEPETHLIPLVLRAASGRQPHITVFGEDYPTRDGTCERDYIHIVDLCDAHLRLLRYLWDGGEERHFNLGTGEGHTVREVIDATRRVTEKEIPVRMAARRPGDAAVLIADGAKARQVLEWRPRYSDLDTILRHAWVWEQRRRLPPP